MAKYILNYRVVIEAEDFDEASAKADELQEEVQSWYYVYDVVCDPYMENY